MSLVFDLDRRPDCPSDLRLDRFALGELERAEHVAVEAHRARCARCAGFLEAREEALPAAVRARLRGRVLAASIAAPTPWWRRGPGALWPRLAPGLALTAGVLVAVSIALFGRSDPARDDAVSLKGGDRLVVYRERDGEVRTVGSGDAFRAGDRLRFAVRSEHAGHAAVFGLEADGDRYPCTPASGSGAHPVGPGTELLPGAIELDAAGGRETLVLVLCPQPFDVAEVGDAAPPGCRRETFSLEKPR